jgi:hypothetical protein
LTWSFRAHLGRIFEAPIISQSEYRCCICGSYTCARQRQGVPCRITCPTPPGHSPPPPPGHRPALLPGPVEDGHSISHGGTGNGDPKVIPRAFARRQRCSNMFSRAFGPSADAGCGVGCGQPEDNVGGCLERIGNRPQFAETPPGLPEPPRPATHLR